MDLSLTYSWIPGLTTEEKEKTRVELKSPVKPNNPINIRDEEPIIRTPVWEYDQFGTPDHLKPTQQDSHVKHQDVKYQDVKHQDIEHQDVKHQDIKHQDIYHQDVNHQDMNDQDVIHQHVKHQELKHQDDHIQLVNFNYLKNQDDHIQDAQVISIGKSDDIIHHDEFNQVTLTDDGVKIIKPHEGNILFNLNTLFPLSILIVEEKKPFFDTVLGMMIPESAQVILG